MNLPKEKNSRIDGFLNNPSKALWTLAIPIMAGMGIHTLYTIVDMIFIGRLGGNAIAAVAFNMPLFFLVLGLSFGVGSGVTASIARFIGAKDKVSADNTAEHAVALGLIISIILTTLGLIYGEDLLRRLGATKSVLPVSWSYLKISLIGLPFMVFSTFFRSILSGEGDMKLPMAVAGLGTIINIILDPIFIFTLEFGVGGAAMASAISQLIVFLIFVYMLFIKEHAYIKFRMGDFSPSMFIVKDIIRVGFPASMSMIIMAFGQLVFNRILVRFSTDAVAAYQVGGRMDMVIFLPIMAIASALTTIVGMFYGAKEFEKIKFIAKYGIICAIMVTSILSILLYIFAPFVVKSFTQEVDIQSIAVTYIRTICLIYPLIAFGMSVGRILQGLGKGLPMLVITSIRILGVSAPLALFFTMVLNKSIEWVWYAMIISTIVSILISLIWLKTTFKNLIKG
ncbi:MAG: MATE family efflux transporter [Candidatus Marinimicrobia bacterium]|jgi:putative MATE family efflux protein|nr:MATE family efflux transporter [Candidatus Neomarinimicrobiota bacterium]MBT4307861.1 MATE family efflux transporter [Candidatus Neomarinimicrobiota bacterium]MBT5385275.1 MATE family efflux transporter [Candidatus Neomarinimicrobiota bacterium]MBT5776764.1 MATE family efflux transporter [Candidatus Neomarinimicrobiota bacterium]MBT5994243.1 MATE family efflux transporter [Candidatus Neomarinimicrobiota bacterium]